MCVYIQALPNADSSKDPENPVGAFLGDYRSSRKNLQVSISLDHENRVVITNPPANLTQEIERFLTKSEDGAVTLHYSKLTATVEYDDGSSVETIKWSNGTVWTALKPVPMSEAEIQAQLDKLMPLLDPDGDGQVNIPHE
jgi:hypothetical protein